jgi:hypothetical protein
VVAAGLVTPRSVCALDPPFNQTTPSRLVASWLACVVSNIDRPRLQSSSSSESPTGNQPHQCQKVQVHAGTY